MVSICSVLFFANVGRDVLQILPYLEFWIEKDVKQVSNINALLFEDVML